MAEQFLSRLNKMEASINQLGETLKRMITILGTVTEIKSEVRIAKDEIIQALANLPSAAPAQPVVDNADEYAKMVYQEVGAVRVFVQESMESLKNDMIGLLTEMVTSIEASAAKAPPTPAPAPAPPVAPSPAPVETPAPAPAPAPTPAPVEDPPVAAAPAPSSIPADRAMKVADQLEIILKSLKMGCVAGKVMDTMT
ncbi:MAG: hypothetical protein ACTSV2_02100, partial [Candidatus Thorarchaeota archaeon]